MTAADWYLAILVVAGVTYLLRAAPLLWRWFYEVGRQNVAFLTYVSFAIAAGIVSKSVIIDAGSLAPVQDLAIKVIAVLIALGLHWQFRSLPLALFGGAAIAVFAKWLVGL